MRESREEFLSRVTLAGWLLLVVVGFGMSALVPLLLARVFPGAFPFIAASRYRFTLVWLACALPTFFAGKLGLAALGIRVIRPREVKPEAGEGRPQAPPSRT